MHVILCFKCIPYFHGIYICLATLNITWCNKRFVVLWLQWLMWNTSQTLKFKKSISVLNFVVLLAITRKNLYEISWISELLMCTYSVTEVGTHTIPRTLSEQAIRQIKMNTINFFFSLGAKDTQNYDTRNYLIYWHFTCRSCRYREYELGHQGTVSYMILNL